MQAYSAPHGKDKTSLFRIAIRWTIYLLIVIVAINVLRAGKYSLYSYLDEKGFSREVFSESPISYTKSIIYYLLDWNGVVRNEVDKIFVDVKFKEWEKIKRNRNESLSKGIIQQDAKKFVKAQIRHDGDIIKTKIRLKGDWTDHLEGDKWSLRFKTRNDDHLFGVREFSVQSPKTRGYIGEPLFLDMLRSNNILAPRYSFIDEVINGNEVGVMAFEEHFSKEMLEFNGRKESVILKFDESLYWQSINSKNNVSYDDYAAAHVSAFNSKKVKRSSVLSKYRMVATGLLRSFVSNKLRASEVFDVDKLGRYLAIVDTWGAWHALRWHNIRFAYNPYTAKLEPIGYDGNITEQQDVFEIPTDNEDISKRFLKDGFIFLSYVNSIKNINEEIHSPSFERNFINSSNRYLSALRKEYLFVPDGESILETIRRRSDVLVDKVMETDAVVSVEGCEGERVRGWAINISDPSEKVLFNLINQNDVLTTVIAEKRYDKFFVYGLSMLGLENPNHGFLVDSDLFFKDKLCEPWVYNVGEDGVLDIGKEISSDQANVPAQYPLESSAQPANVYLIEDDGRGIIEIENIINHDFIISDLIIYDEDSGASRNIQLLPQIDLPAKDARGYYGAVRFDLEKHIGTLDDSYVYNVIIKSKSEEAVTYNVRAIDYYPSLSQLPVPQAKISALPLSHPYIDVNKSEREIVLHPGTHKVYSSIIIPSGYSMRIPSATILIFSPNTYILSYGSLYSEGTKRSPVIMRGEDGNKDWGGIVSIGNGSQQIQLKNTELYNVSAVEENNWMVTGGVSLYRNNILIDSCLFSDNSSEDFVNIINSTFIINGSVINRAASDAFDSDFSDGKIVSSSFYNIGYSGGGDAVDVSGSHVTISDSVFEKIDDKAISVGENSSLVGDRLAVLESGSAIVVKDGSEAIIRNSRIERSSLAAVMAYKKKEEYGGALMNIMNTAFAENNIRSIVQTGNAIIIDDVYETEEDLDVDLLYDTKMKPGMK